MLITCPAAGQSGSGKTGNYIMYSIDTAAGQVVADDLQQSIESVNAAVMSYANLCASIVEVNKASNLPITTAQEALQNAAEGLNKLVASRADMANATRELLDIQKASTLETVSFGCPEGFPPKTAKLQEPATRSQIA